MIDDLHKLINEYKKERTKLFEQLSLGDDGWELYNKRMKVLWHKIKIELDDTLSLSLEDVQIIHDIAKEQCDNIYDDYYNLCSMIKIKNDIQQER